MFPRGTASRDDCDAISLWERLSVFFIGVQLVLRRWLRRFLEPGALLVSVAVVVAGVTGILRTVDIPSNDAWKDHSPLNIVYAISAVIALVGAFLVGLSYASTLRRETSRDELADLCKTLWVMALRHTSIPFDKLGVHVCGRHGSR
jgi:hypothetical protein